MNTATGFLSARLEVLLYFRRCFFTPLTAATESALETVKVGFKCHPFTVNKTDSCPAALTRQDAVHVRYVTGRVQTSRGSGLWCKTRWMKEKPNTNQEISARPLTLGTFEAKQPV